jgi:mRNA interferase RelE/StbE
VDKRHYHVRLRRSAEKDLRRLMPSDYSRVIATILSLRDDPRPSGCKKLVAGEGWRIRVGIFRVVYDVDDAAMEVDIRGVIHRKDAYR